MKFATYNVEVGGFNSYQDYETKYPPRMDAIAEVVIGLDADVVALTDTFRWHTFDLAYLRETFSYGHVVTQPIGDKTMGVSGKNIGLTLLSNREIINPSPVDLGERQALSADIEFDDSTIVTSITAYLHHADEAKRTQQVGGLVGYATRTGRLERTVVEGDLNTISRLDKTAQQLRHLLRLIPSGVRPEAIANVLGNLEGTAYQRLMKAGFRDANKERAATWPTPRYGILGGRIAVPAMLRLDHILHSPDITAVSHTVPRGRAYRLGSDHYPSVADLMSAT